MNTLRVILGDQLTRSISSLSGLDPANDQILMVEVPRETTYVGHHKQKLVLILSAMRHFADELRREGISVRYTQLDDPDNGGSFTGELKRAITELEPDRVVVTEPGEWRVLEEIIAWPDDFGIPVQVRKDDRFFATRDRFAAWADSRRQLRMEYFYRELRRETGLLMEGGKPVGGQWNFDPENRKTLPKNTNPPTRKFFPPDGQTKDVMALVERLHPENFGTVDNFDWPVTRNDALTLLDEFTDFVLPNFGDYQDAMKQDNAFLYHSLLSPALNIGLLTPAEVCRRAEAAYKNGTVPINAAEGFIRQILGWREYVRGVYWTYMPEYAASNALNAVRPLPWLYWSGETDMNCMRSAISDTRQYAYSHHIQRLMVTGNFALLAGVRPAEIEEWYLAVYADAFEWVELPNTHGMAIFADGGKLASKPYAASGAYINRMSDYCRYCRYDVKNKEGDDACPFNYLYWDFLIRNESHLAGIPRMAFPYKNLAGWDAAQKKTVRQNAARFLDSLE